MDSYNLYFISRIENDDLFEETEAIRSGRTVPLKLKSHERRCLAGLVKDLYPLCPSPAFFDGFVFSYTIPHIGKEFDLLKVSDTGILNIELKSSNVGKESIKEQLLKNKYYLSHLSKPLTLFTYVLKGNLYYTLDENEELVPSSHHEVALSLSLHAGGYTKDIDPLFCACRYLISPVGEPERFVSGNYFLTQHQQHAKQKILSKADAFDITAITGSVGTGKTLLLYDLCKTFSALGKRCLFLHPGALKEGHAVLNRQIKNMTVSSISNADRFAKEDFDCLFVDEANMLKYDSFMRLSKWARQGKFTLFLTYDPDAGTSLQEQRDGITREIEQTRSIRKIRLTNTIRTNESILTFTAAFLGRKNFKGPLDSRQIEVLYLPKSSVDAILPYYKERQYAIFHCSAVGADLEQPQSFLESERGVVIVGDGYKYGKNGRLCCPGMPKNREQILICRLEKAILHVRERLVVIVSDEQLYRRLLTFFKKG